MTSDTDPSKRPSYWEYLRIEELLALQGGIEGDEKRLSDHEVLFIVVHQVFELWFKLLLRELTTIRDRLNVDHVPDQDMSLIVSSLQRCRVILDRATDHFQVMETLTTRDFLDFRDKVLPASGFQSAQMRELEVLLGLSDAQRISLGADGSYLRALEGFDGEASPALERVLRRKADSPPLSEVVDAWLYRTPINGSCPSKPDDADAVRRFVDGYAQACRDDAGDLDELTARQTRTAEGRAALRQRYEESLASVRAFLAADDVAAAGPEAQARRSRIRAAIVFIESHRDEPLLAWPRAAIAGFVALEQAMVIFRQRHARMVEREIGRRIGTGGSAGVDYLDQTALTYRVFRDLWAARTILLRKGAVPPLDDTEHVYGFRYGS